MARRRRHADRALDGRAPVPGRPAARGAASWPGAPRRPSTPTGATCPGSWAPTAVVWGEDNRTCGFRVVGHGAGRRVESRIPGADVNPYLVLAAAIAAGLYGIDHELELATAYPRNAYEATDVPRIPSTLVEAIDELRDSEVAAEAFGPDVHHHLLNTAEQEWEASQPPRDGLGAGPQLRAHVAPGRRWAFVVPGQRLFDARRGPLRCAPVSTSLAGATADPGTQLLDDEATSSSSSSRPAAGTVLNGPLRVAWYVGLGLFAVQFILLVLHSVVPVGPLRPDGRLRGSTARPGNRSPPGTSTRTTPRTPGTTRTTATPSTKATSS